ncbi:MAG: BACON domain-containing protein [Saprospiraceae bacterium]|nr:BACON domain-containing protein [Candidatus Vicinibacter affinis]
MDCKSQTRTLLFTSTSDWQLQDKPSWVQSVQPSSGFPLNTNVTISILPNNSPNSRNDFITISYGTPSQTYKIPISQKPCPINNYCFFDPSILNIDEYDSTFTVKVNSNSTWSYNTGELSWVTVNPKIGSGSGQITISVSANSTNQSRSTKLVFNCGTSGNTFSLDVIQAMNSCSFSAIPNTIMIGVNGGVIDTLKINSSSTWFRCDNESDISTDNNLIGGPLVKDRIGY